MKLCRLFLPCCLCLGTVMPPPLPVRKSGRRISTGKGLASLLMAKDPVKSPAVALPPKQGRLLWGTSPQTQLQIVSVTAWDTTAQSFIQSQVQSNLIAQSTSAGVYWSPTLNPPAWQYLGTSTSNSFPVPLSGAGFYHVWVTNWWP